jgi:hypothetical protein
MPTVRIISYWNIPTDRTGICTALNRTTSYNRIKSILEVERLSKLPCLESLKLEGNPLATSKLFRLRALSVLPPSTVLDGQPINKVAMQPLPMKIRPS